MTVPLWFHGTEEFQKNSIENEARKPLPDVRVNNPTWVDDLSGCCKN